VEFTYIEVGEKVNQCICWGCDCVIITDKLHQKTVTLSIVITIECKANSWTQIFWCQILAICRIKQNLIGLYYKNYCEIALFMIK